MDILDRMAPMDTFAVRTTSIRLFGRQAYDVSPIKDGDVPTIVFYHGWASNAKRQIFRAQILASWGYRIFVYDALSHGRDDSVEYGKAFSLAHHFWKAVNHHVTIWPQLMEVLERDYRSNISRVSVMGHSMGGITVLALMAAYDDIFAGISYNGCSDWDYLNNHFLKMNPEFREAYCKTDRMNNGSYTLGCFVSVLQQKETLINRHLLLTNGANDFEVPKEGNAELSTFLESKNQLKRFHHIVYPEVGHVVTDHMLFDGLEFLHRAHCFI